MRGQCALRVLSKNILSIRDSLLAQHPRARSGLLLRGLLELRELGLGGALGCGPSLVGSELRGERALRHFFFVLNLPDFIQLLLTLLQVLYASVELVVVRDQAGRVEGGLLRQLNSRGLRFLRPRFLLRPTLRQIVTDVFAIVPRKQQVDGVIVIQQPVIALFDVLNNFLHKFHRVAVTKVLCYVGLRLLFALRLVLLRGLLWGILVHIEHLRIPSLVKHLHLAGAEEVRRLDLLEVLGKNLVIAADIDYAACC